MLDKGIRSVLQMTSYLSLTTLYFLRNFRIGPISWSVCHWQTLSSLVHWAHNNDNVDNNIKLSHTSVKLNREDRGKISISLMPDAECHYVECHYAECHYTECRYAKCHGALSTHSR
jgi:hypothetical protein